RPRAADHRRQAALHVVVLRRPGTHADAHGGVALPHGNAGPTGAIRLDGIDDLARALGVAESHHDLVQHDFVQYLEAGRREALREASRLRAVAFHHLRESAAPEAQQRGVYLGTARAARELGREVGGRAPPAR